MSLKSLSTFIAKFSYGSRVERDTLRSAMRSSLRLRQEGRAHEVEDTMRRFAENRLDVPEVTLSKLLGPDSEKTISMFCTQKAFERIDTNGFRRQLLQALANPSYSIEYPIPQQWQKLLTSSGFQVNKVKSTLLWYLFCLKLWWVGLILCLEVALEPTRDDGEIVRKIESGGSWAFFADLRKDCILEKGNNSPSYNLRSWFQDYLPADEAFTAGGRKLSSRQCLQYGVLYSKSGLLSLRGIGLRARFFCTSIIVALECLLRSRENNYQLLVFREYAMLKKASVQLMEHLPKSIYFANSNYLVRPLWTFLAEQRSAKVVLYYYSTNNEPFGNNVEKKRVNPGFSLITWPNLMVWHERQSTFFKSIVNADIRCEVVGPIWFEDASESPQDYSIDLVIFDVTPFRPSFYRILCPPRDYYVAQNGIAFLQEIIAACRLMNITPSMKYKRPPSISSLFDRRYLNVVAKMVSSGDLNLLAPEISAQHYIRSAKLVISRPFTSTAYMATQLGRPSVFFDPSGITSHADESAAGVPVLTDIEELKSWIAGNI